MPAIPAPSPEHVRSEGEARARVREILAEAAATLLGPQPGRGGFRQTRPGRDRSSGGSWQGLRTMIHVSGLLVAELPAGRENLEQRARDLDGPLAALGFHRLPEPTASSLLQVRWRCVDGELFELLGGSRLGLRVISAEFLPTTRETLSSTSPITPPARPLR
ncbi:hypothetical protein [Brachybacterium hainanense]|uniref:Uncharacterized protein n=1 Tax=Brachybacterium hainanense TaxID=1541174 RepID=A0ABV6RGX0_9MICO